MTRMGGSWRNWGRSEAVKPKRIERPSTADAVQRAVQAALRQGLSLKAIGAGHSFTGIAVAPGILLDMDDLTGVVSVDLERSQVTFAAGTRLHRIPSLLAPYGLAMQNLGDIDRQSLAGAISTGTHGTGAMWGGIATQLVGARLVTGEGEFLRISEEENAELLPAIAVGLGALGVLVEVTLQCVPAFALEAVEHPEALEEVLRTLDERVSAADHFEFYWFPHTEVALTKTQTRRPGDAPLAPLPAVGKWLDESFLSNGVFRVVCATATQIPAIVPGFNRLAVALTGDREYTDLSHRVLTQARNVRFREMEFALPMENIVTAFNEVRTLIAERGWRITFPVEVRFAAQDDLWLSTATGRRTGYIAVHRYYREDPNEYFSAVENIMTRHGGRPHWGKMHTRDAEYFVAQYPRFGDFLALRERLDPGGLFLNPHLRRILGVHSAPDA